MRRDTNRDNGDGDDVDDDHVLNSKVHVKDSIHNCCCSMLFVVVVGGDDTTVATRERGDLEYDVLHRLLYGCSVKEEKKKGEMMGDDKQLSTRTTTTGFRHSALCADW